MDSTDVQQKLSADPSLSPIERARQLRKPEGKVGLAIARETSSSNSSGNKRLIGELAIASGQRVLEIGFGIGITAELVLAQAERVRYTGLDYSETMVGEALKLHADLVDAGSAQFLLGSAENMPFPDVEFDRIFSTGVVHFWNDAPRALRECRRVLKAGGTMLMGCLAATMAPPFASEENGFYLREGRQWQALCSSAGFAQIKTDEIAITHSRPDGQIVTLPALRIEAQ